MHLTRPLTTASFAALAVMLAAVLVSLRPLAAGADTVHHVSLLAASMQPVDSSIEYNNASSLLTTVTESTLGTTSYVGQLSLPDGSTVSGVRCEGTDTDPGAEFVVRMYRYRLEDEPDVRTGVTGFAGSVPLFAAGDTIVEPSVDADAAHVDNAEYSYAIVASLPKATTSKTLGLLRCTVDITYKSAFLPTAYR